MAFTIDAILTGKAMRFTDEGERSAIAKVPVDCALTVGFLGLSGDEQADLSVHGGPDKAIHHYPRDHYDFWQSELDGHALLNAPGAFGENISTLGMNEDEMCIGDRFRLGSALVEISQGRQPCWKLGHRFDVAKVPAMVVRTRRSGWYYRVIEEGAVAAGERLDLTERRYPEWSVSRVFGLLIGGDAKKDPAATRALTTLPPLAETWKVRAGRLGQ